MSKTLTARMYKSPAGRMREIQMSNIYQEEIDFFVDNDIMVSIEETALGIVLYACPKSDDSEESEVIVFAGKKSCQESMQELRQLCEDKFIQ
jgi:hypothetical protein